MILVDSQIKEAMGHELCVTPFDPALVNPASLDIRLGRYYTLTKPVNYGQILGMPQYGCVDPQDKATFVTETKELGSYWLKPQETVLVSMYEHLALGSTISAKVMGKSSLARLGLNNSSEAGWIDAGWRGVITLELTNHSSFALKLTEGMKIGQLIFFKHAEVGKSYQETGRYLDQVPGQGSLGV